VRQQALETEKAIRSRRGTNWSRCWSHL